MTLRQALAALTTFAALPALAAGPIKIGSFQDVTGSASLLGDLELKTLKLYIEEVNAKGEIGGHPVTLMRYDSAGDSKNPVGCGELANRIRRRLVGAAPPPRPGRRPWLGRRWLVQCP